VKIESWLKSNTFHHSAFWDLNALVEEKQKQDLKISLCIPTLNEEKTIGKEIVIFKSELMQRHPLLDEIAVIDSDSSDQTRDVASAFGAQVFLSKEILKKYGEKRGKGENLWKAIYQCEGDILVYIDADIKNIHPRFVYGLVAPLIYRPEIHYVKAFYDRPLASSQGSRPSGGGRVTEILIRPLFSLFFPELAALIQPLSGEYAVRRQVLDKIPFPIGYGVETSHLIDVYHRWGLQAIGPGVEHVSAAISTACAEETDGNPVSWNPDLGLHGGNNPDRELQSSGPADIPSSGGGSPARVCEKGACPAVPLELPPVRTENVE